MNERITIAVWGILIPLNTILVVCWKNSWATESAPLHVLTQGVVFFTLVALSIYVLRGIFPLSRARNWKHIVLILTKLAALPLYGWFAFAFLTSSIVTFPDVSSEETLYRSPSGQRELIFIKKCPVHKCLNLIYERREGAEILMKTEDIKTISDGEIVPGEDIDDENEWDRYLDAFHEPSNLKLDWGPDENSVKWTVRVDSNKLVEGTVVFEVEEQ